MIAPLVLTPLNQVALLAAFRALPIATYEVVSGHSSAGRRFRAALAYGLLLLGNVYAGNAAKLGWCLLGSAYYLACACAVPAAARALRARVISRAALFIVATACCLVLPGLLMPGIAVGLFLVVGWELLLSAYSYCCEVSAEPFDPGLSACLFFLLVNPALNYTNRGTSVRMLPAASRSAIKRAALGVLLLFASLCVPGVELALLRANAAFPRAATSLAVVALGGLRLVGLYAAHSGLAHMQLGLLRQTGYAAPERYRKPFLARNPSDFWRRWNTYVGEWLRRYVFIPSVERLKPVQHARSARLAALCVTLLASGLLHDAFAYASQRVVTTRALEFFAASGIAMLAWFAAARLRRQLFSGARGSELTLRFTSRLSLWAALVGACALWG
jgi:hypothetical protein